MSLPSGRILQVTWRVEEGYLLMGGRLTSGITDTTVLLKHDGTFESGTFHLIKKIT